MLWHSVGSIALKWCKRCYCAIWRQLWCVTRFSWQFVFYEVKFCFRLIEIHWLCFYLDQTSVWVSFCHSVLYRQVPGAASGCTRHEIKGTPALTCHETAYSALYASLPVRSTISASNGSSTCSSRFSARLTGHPVHSADCLVGRSTFLSLHQFVFSPHQLTCLKIILYFHALCYSPYLQYRNAK